MFYITQGKGFFIVFENGYKISVQFGNGNYCANRNDDDIFTMDYKVAQGKCGEKGSPDAEIAIINAEGNFVGEELSIFDGDRIEGWCSPARVLEVMNAIAVLPKQET